MLPTTVQTKLIKIGGQLVRHAGRLVFQGAESMVTRDMYDEMLERIGRLRFNPGEQGALTKGIVSMLRSPGARCVIILGGLV